MFKFRNSNNQVMLINDIDRLACKFWNKEYDDHSYASPFEDSDINWYDVLGHAIENLQYMPNRVVDGFVSARDVNKMIAFDYNLTTESMLKAMTPFINFVTYLQSQGIKFEPCGW